uniref:Uncharacterized protein n=1 Tax=Melopsittacus undulatus TaxID=13146 RepID=A0A8V5HAD5_MELUD
SKLILLLVKRWKISLRNEFCELRLGEIKESQEDFLGDSSLHTMSKPLSNDFKPLLLRQIMIPSLLVEICNSNAFWENTVGNLCGTITPEMKELAQAMAWNLFFTVFNHRYISFKKKKRKLREIITSIYK